jgi:hypothetical protein
MPLEPETSLEVERLESQWKVKIGKTSKKRTKSREDATNATHIKPSKLSNPTFTKFPSIMTTGVPSLKLSKEK